MTAENEQPDRKVNVSAVNANVGLPSLMLTKSVSPERAKAGQTVVYTIKAVNEGDVDLLNIRVTDSVIGLDQRIDHMESGTEIVFRWPYVIPFDTPSGQLTNVMNIQGSNMKPQAVSVSFEVLSGARMSVNIIPDKVLVKPGERVVYEITVVNTGNVELTQVELTEGQTLLNRRMPNIPVGERRSITTEYTVPLGTPPGIYTSRAIVDASEIMDQITASSAIEVVAVKAIGVRVLSDRQTVTPGSTVHYAITVGNLGNVPLEPVRIVDSLTGIDVKIAVLEVAQFFDTSTTYDVPVEAAIGLQIVNNVTAMSIDVEPTVAETLVTVVSAGLVISIQGHPTVTGGTAAVITYTITVTNEEIFPQTNVVLNIPNIPFTRTIPVLAPGATEIIAKPYILSNQSLRIQGRFPFLQLNAGTTTLIVLFPKPGSVVTTSLFVHSDQTAVQRISYQTLIVNSFGLPALNVRKLSDRTMALPGENVNYIAEVTNENEFVATDVVVRDELTGTEQTVPALWEGMIARLVFPFTIPEDALQGETIVNTVTVRSTSHTDQALPIAATASASVFVIAEPAPALLLASSAAPNPVPNNGDTEITITVTNRTDGILTNVRILESLTMFATVIPELSPGQSLFYKLPFHIPQQTVGGTIFTSYTSAVADQTRLEQQIFNIVTSVLSDIRLTQTANREEASPGDAIIFTIRIGNASNVPIVNGNLFAPLFSLRMQTESFQIGAEQVIVLRFVVPEGMDDDGDLISWVYLSSDNGPTLQVSTAVRIVIDEE
ncbi:DUF7507 domain-containing protein [Paenibacillus harenae]|uniref:Repeat protein (TIGR01451 family) n=1 Tax=Paenibacillus harenae TaxID=306543 RepID=A0ABT9UAI7_PAEHA|nr:hypothetical protein [Paenibacillus harenae]MDQ0116036.1 putative repeat protein (TIGR01451 family) [Paenibacillus harenae]